MKAPLLMAINKQYKKFEDQYVEAEPVEGYEDAPEIINGKCVVTESRPLSGGPVLAFIYTVEGFSVKPETLKKKGTNNERPK